MKNEDYEDMDAGLYLRSGDYVFFLPSIFEAIFGEKCYPLIFRLFLKAWLGDGLRALWAEVRWFTSNGVLTIDYKFKWVEWNAIW